MADKPILFSAPMVRALLAGTKSQTRRICKDMARWVDQDCREARQDQLGEWHQAIVGAALPYAKIKLPYAKGDKLWVRESWAVASVFTDVVEVRYRASERASHTEFVEQIPVSIAGNPKTTWPKWRPSMFMPRWASRLTLTVTDVRVQRLQDITREDAIAEGITRARVIVGANCNGGRHSEEHGDRYFFDGCPDEGFEDAVSAYAALWKSLHLETIPLLDEDGKKIGIQPNPARWDANPWVVAVSFETRKGNIDG